MAYSVSRQQFAYRDRVNSAQHQSYCPGFLDVTGLWNNGFYCSRSRDVFLFCCGDESYRFCCDTAPTEQLTVVDETAAAAAAAWSAGRAQSTPAAGIRHTDVSATASGGVLAVCAAVSTILLLSLLAAIYIYRQRRTDISSSAASTGVNGQASTTQSLTEADTANTGCHISATPTSSHIHMTSLQATPPHHDVSLTPWRRPHIAIAMAQKLTALLRHWLDRLLAGVRSHQPVTSQHQTVSSVS